MIVNQIKGIHPKIKDALSFISSISKEKLFVAKHGNTGKKVIIGKYNSLSGGRSDMHSNLAKHNILKAFKVPSFPKQVDFLEHAKGLMIVLIEPKETKEIEE